MKRVDHVSFCRSSRRLAALTGAALILTMAGGCAGGTKVRSVEEPVVVQEPISMEPSVMHFNDGRTGFVITEVPQLDPVALQDFTLGVEALERQDYEMAIEFFDKVVGLAPEITAPYINIAKAYEKIDRPEIAEDYLLRALTLVPGHPLASHQYGLLLRRAGRFTEAREVYQTSLEHFPEYHPIRRNLAILCDLYLGDPECALEQYELYSQSRPDHEQVKLWISEVSLRAGR